MEPPLEIFVYDEIWVTEYVICTKRKHLPDITHPRGDVVSYIGLGDAEDQWQTEDGYYSSPALQGSIQNKQNLASSSTSKLQGNAKKTSIEGSSNSLDRLGDSEQTWRNKGGGTNPLANPQGSIKNSPKEGGSSNPYRITGGL